MATDRTQREIERSAASPATPQSTTPSTPNYLNEARQRFYATMAERERLIGERKALADSLMQIQQQRIDKALAIANLGTEVGIENIVRERQFQEGKKARLQDLENMYAQHAAKYGMALNKQAIEILKEFSNINAPTLTSIMTGYEMARTSAMENDARRLENFTKLNESYNAIQKELLASNQREAELKQQLRINEEQAKLDMLDYRIKSKAEELDNMKKQHGELADDYAKWAQIEAIRLKSAEGEKPSISMRDLSPTEGGGTGKSALTAKEIAIKLGDADSRISGSALVLPEEFTNAYEQNLATYVEGTGSSLEKVLKDPNALKKVYNFTFDDFLKNKKIVPVEGSDNKFFKFNVGTEEGKGAEESEKKANKDAVSLAKQELFSTMNERGLSSENDISTSDEPGIDLVPVFQRKLSGEGVEFSNIWRQLTKIKTGKASNPTTDDWIKFRDSSEEEKIKFYKDAADIIKNGNKKTSFVQPPSEDVTDLEALYVDSEVGYA